MLTMSKSVIEYAKAVQESLADLGAELSFVPDFTLADTQIKRCVVVPIGVEKKILSRVSVEKTYRLDVAILHKIKLSKEVEQHIPAVEDVANRLLTKPILSGVCVKTEISPLYSVEAILQKNLFVGIVSISIKVVS